MRQLGAERAALLAHLTDDQIRVAAAYHFDHQTQQEIADDFGMSRVAVCRVLKAFASVMEMLDISMPDRFGPDTRHIRNIDADVMRAL